MTKLVCYCRVSTEGQKDNTSLDHQRSKIMAYCQSRDHEIVGFFEDVETASGVKRRPGLENAFQTVYSGQADGIVCYRLDRFARSTTDGLEMASRLEQAGKQLVILDLNLDTTTPAGRCMFTILLAFAQLEKDTIRERTLSGKREKQSKGGYVHGHPPFGWRAANGELIPDLEEQKTRQLIFELYRQGFSSYHIAANLNELQLPSKRGGAWLPCSVRQVLKKSKLTRQLEKRCPEFVLTPAWSYPRSVR